MFRFGNKCRRIRRLLSDRIDASLPDRVEKKVLAHLDSCRECREEYAFYQELKKAASHIDIVSPPLYLWDRVAISLEDHPWGEEESIPTRKRERVSRALTGKINFAGAILSLALVAVLSLTPGGTFNNSASVYRSMAYQDVGNRDMEYISLFMMTNRDRFPDAVREHYLGHMEGLNQRIKTIKSALERFSQNNHIKAQLAMAYRQKIELYEQMGLKHEGGGGKALPGDFAGDDFLRGGRYE
jgi:hypothetical protein